MRVLITGVCGFVGSTIAQHLIASSANVNVCGVDNLMRPGSETNRTRLKQLGVHFIHGDIRNASDVEALPDVDWVIDAAANPSVLAGVGAGGGSRQLMEHNLGSLIHILEFCKSRKAGLLLLSTSRVYSIEQLTKLPLRDNGDAFALDTTAQLPRGLSPKGIGPDFSTEAPISLYGSTKLACEVLAVEYGQAFDFPVWINRCGVLTGPGQFGTPDQGIFAFWVNAHLRRHPLRYIGFGGKGKQVRDAFHPVDLAELLVLQMASGRTGGRRIYTAGGGQSNAMSLAQLTAWCDQRFGAYEPASDSRSRQYDIAWMVMDNTLATRDFGWTPKLGLRQTLAQIADHAEQNPEWLRLSGVGA